MADPPAAVEVDELVVRYGELTAVDHLSFRADAGQVTALLGPNGAGKTSTIETAEGYRRPAAGRVRVLGLDPVADHAEVVRSLGIMLQRGGVYPGIRPLEAIELFAAYYDEPLDPRALLERVGLGDRQSTTWRRLSGGEQQRLSLALALVGRPRVVVLDEPTAGLDVTGRQLVHRIVGELRDDGVAVLLATHDLADAEALADHVVIIDHGVAVADGPLDRILSGEGDEIRFTSTPGLDVDALGGHLGAPVEEVRPGTYLARRAPDPAAVAALTAWLAERGAALGELRAGRQRLEDVFVRLTAEPTAGEDRR
ncbi:ABC transporter ATP-binding protein [Actinomarinicola tropica]|uniref:ATP-binding cassette domain-containing protein n=1 Tax=Actinomarinicola tropica TaxID=2789776 RepID=A0A5Q2RP47_9ACTN|nr:ABC transporter ATP-binding protein [Actinomarinicola tropica]QGG96722.1 ATP-binding cassette domain-containing protein [Actinomarinicola tropica]